MDATLPNITPAALAALLYRPAAPLVVDVRREIRFVEAETMIAGAIRRPPDTVADWFGALPGDREIVVYCVHGLEIGQGACAALLERGRRARYLVGGIEDWIGAGLPTLRKRAPLSARPSRWVTRERPKIDRLACPWLIRRFIDPLAEFLYVPTAEVNEAAKRADAVAYDIPGVEFGHDGPRCSFDAFIKGFGLAAPGLDLLADIVRGADTDDLDLAPESRGLLAASLGLGLVIEDDHRLLEAVMPLYDGLHAWCRSGRAGRHDWKPETMNVRRAP
ncbi:MAG: hypothetical protein FJX47_10655 [Alphaproteobacteria bacterium]|nr:hypothetical protein [Alphaproteobacteria bacterium]